MLRSGLRDSLVGISLLLVLATLAAGCGQQAPASKPAAAPAPAPASGGQPAPAPKPNLGLLTIVHLGPGINHSIIDLAIARQYFEDEGFSKVEYMQIGSGQSAVAALLKGDGDVGIMGTSEVAKGFAAGQKDLVMLGAMYKGFPVWMVVRTSILKERNVNRSSPMAARVQALKGLKIGVLGAGSTVDLFARFVFTQAGQNPDTYAELIPFDAPSSILAAFQANRIDAFPLANPDIAQVESNGTGQILIAGTEFSEFQGYVQNPFAARRSAVAKDPQRYAAFARAIVRAGQFLLKSPDQARDIVAKGFPKITAEVFAKAWATETDPSTGPIYAAAKDPTIADAELNKVLAIIKVKDVKPSDLVDNTVFQKAMATVK